MNEELSNKPGSRRKAILLTLLALVLLLSSILWISGRKELTYEGKPFSYWLDWLPVTVAVPGPGGTMIPTSQRLKDLVSPLRKQAFKAIHEVGPGELTLLVHRLGLRDSNMENVIFEWAYKAGWHRGGMTAFDKRGKALTALLELGGQATPVVPDLVRLTGDPDPSVRQAAMLVLLRVAPSKANELQKATGTNWSFVAVRLGD